ncbi:MAG TPA: ABC transporter permease, partial [Thermoanaerobaculia bacterium]|nr:ABC transporter permease [Thermoanaerobaculia bacterium]
IRYKRSVLGIGWTMLSPLLNMVALTIAFSAILKQAIWNYPVYYLTGYLIWAFFAQATGHAATLTVDAVEITQRIYIPRSVFVASAVGVALVNLVLSLVPLLFIIVATLYPVRWTWVFLPVSMVVAAVFTCGVGLVVFTLASRFADVKETYLVLLSSWFFATPIVYSPQIVPAKYRLIIDANPMTYIVELFRAPIYQGALPDLRTFGIATAIALATFLLGWLLYAAKIEDYASRS